jgi:inhibitor of KinA
MLYEHTKYLVAGDKALVMEFGNSISEGINNKIRSVSIAIEKSGIKGITEIVPTYRSLMVHYDPMTIGYDALLEKLTALEEQLESIELPEPCTYVIPTLYGGEFGPDIENVASHNGLTVEDVIRIHTSRSYLIYMLGFTPGFPYLGGMDERIATPRLGTPRTKISAGSVGIAAAQTGIYPIESPGGWQLIGRTPLKLYDPYRESPILLKAGNYIRFTAIDREQYDSIKQEVDKGTYKYIIHTGKGGS